MQTVMGDSESDEKKKGGGFRGRMRRFRDRFSSSSGGESDDEGQPEKEKRKKKKGKASSTDGDESSADDKSKERKRDRVKRLFGKKSAASSSSSGGTTATSGESGTSGEETDEDGDKKEKTSDGKDTKTKASKTSSKSKSAKSDKTEDDDDPETNGGGTKSKAKKKPAKGKKKTGGGGDGDSDGGGKADKDNQEPDKGADTEFQIRVVVLEAKELEGGRKIDPFCRVSVGDMLQPTRTLRSTDTPLWNQSLYFTLKTSRNKLPHTKLEMRVYTARKDQGGELLIGSYDVTLGAIYGQKRHSFVRRWAALTRKVGEEELGGMDSGVSGFLRFSVSVLAPGQRGPDLAIEKRAFWRRARAIHHSDSDDDADEARVLFSGAASFRSVTLVVRIHDLADLPPTSTWKKKSVFSLTRESAAKKGAEKPYWVSVVASVAGLSAVTARVETSSNRINQEIRIPIKWPTIAKHLSLDLLGFTKKDGKTSDKHLGTYRLLFSQISHAGNDGFLPCFGPAYLSFYGNKGKKSGSKDSAFATLFKGRALVEVLTVDGTGDSAKPDVQQMSNTQLQTSSPFARTDKFILFGSFFAGNMIGQAYKSDKVSFEISLGVYGNAAYPNAFPCSSRTTPVMPQYDGSHYYCMPWGSHKPCAVIPAFFEPSLYRLEARNVLERMSRKVRAVAEEVSQRIGGRDDPDLASEVIGLIDNLAAHIAFNLPDNFPRPSASSSLTSALDRQLLDLRLEEAKEVGRELMRLRDLPVSIPDASHLLLTLAERLLSLSIDPQGNIPDVVIWMLAGGERVAYTSVPAHRVLYSEAECSMGEECGQVQACPLRPVRQDSLGSFGDLPALLQVRLWLGREEHQAAWKGFIEPGLMRFYAETYENQKRGVGGDSYGPSTSHPRPWSNEDESVALPKDGFRAPQGWEFDGKWDISRTFDVWVDRDAGYQKFEEELYELQKKNMKRDEWQEMAWTDYDGFVTVGRAEFICPDNWEWSGGWAVDKVCPGDDHGWVYTSHAGQKGLGDAFQTDFDCSERVQHAYRRRRWIRRRILTGPGGAEEGKATMKMGDPDGWEYTTKLTKPTHLRKRYEDKYRRRRWHRELKAMTESGERSLFSKLSMRVLIGEWPGGSDVEGADGRNFVDVAFQSAIVFDKVHKWQLRAHVYQARDLFHASSANNTFARIVFMNRAQQTKLVLGSVNPMYQQTLIFEKVLITGSAKQIEAYPPVIAVEVFADRQGLPPEFLGRCFAQVSAVCTVAKLRDREFEHGHLKWYPLEFACSKFHGDLLATFELYEADHVEFVPQYPAIKNMAALEEAKKAGKTIPKPVYEVPKEIRPEYRQWCIEFLCWGVRNLRRYQMTSVRHPFVEFIVSNRIHTTNVIADAKRNPNFEDPLMRIDNVALPKEVNLSTPIQMVLKDQRSFGRKPTVGVCLIKDFRAYEVAKPDDGDGDREWEAKLGEMLAGDEKEMAVVSSQRRRFKKQRDDSAAAATVIAAAMAEASLAEASGAVPFDWWSKYYASAGDHAKSQNYLASGLELVPILPGKLEEVGVYAGFEDFCQTFSLYRIQRLKSSDPENCEYQGEIKGRLLMYRADKKGATAPVGRPMPGWEFTGPAAVCIRVYVVRAKGLQSRKKDGTMSTYIQIKIGGKTVDSRKRSRQEPGNPEFGEMFEFKSLSIPQDKDLSVAVYDRRTIGPNVELGTTKVDLENRLLTKWRGTVGLPAQFHVGGVNAWRDQWSPLRTLLHYARLHQLPAVTLSKDDKGLFSITLGKDEKAKNRRAFVFHESELDEVLPPHWRLWREGELGSAKQQLALYVLRRLALVPEHIESRQLHNSLDPNKRVGTLEMWVDILPLSYGPVPPPVDISLRTPIPMQLRLVVWSLRDCVCNKKSMGATVGDLCVRAFISGLDKGQKTDIHYRSLDGSGSFNWRMLFNFDYSPWDREVIAHKRKHFWRRKTDEKLAPELVIQVLDNNKFKKDAVIGETRLNLLDCEVGQPDPEAMSNIKRLKQAIMCGMCKKKGGEVLHKPIPLDEYKRKAGGAEPITKAPKSSRGCCGRRKKGPAGLGRVSLLSQKRTKGWWVVTRGAEEAEQKGEGEMVTGKVELELALMEKKAAEADPVGAGRKKPNHSPELKSPDRPLLDRHWLTSRFGLFKSMVWRKWKCKIITGIIILIVGVIIVFIVFHVPSLVGQALIKK